MTYTLTYRGTDHTFSEVNDTCVTCNEHRSYFEPEVMSYLSAPADGWGVWSLDSRTMAAVTLYTPVGFEGPSSVKLGLSEGEVSLMIERLTEVRAELTAKRLEGELLEARKQSALWNETAKEAAAEAREAAARVMLLETELQEAKGINPWY